MIELQLVSEETARMLPRCFVFCALLLVPLSPNVSRFGRNINIGPPQQFHNVTCYLCSVSIDGHESGSVCAFAGNVFLNGAVDGNVLVLGGNLTLTGNAKVGGHTVIFGGHVQQDPAASTAFQTVLPPIVFLPVILIICVTIGGLIVFTRSKVREPAAFPPLPRL